MDDLPQLPTYPDEYLAGLSPAELIDTVIEDEDRVPRNVIDECARRGDEMTEHLGRLHQGDFLWLPEDEGGAIWLQHHAVMILGLIPSEQAGLLLVELLRRMSLEDYDDSMQDWIAGYWPALFKNKPDSVLPALRALCEDRDVDDYMRANAIDPVIFAASRQGGEALEDAMAWLAGLVADEEEDRDFRLIACITLLYFPRAQYRQLLEGLAAQQGGWWVHFSMQDVQQAYAGEYPAPEWERFENPWAFYEPDAITKRQIRWREEDAKANLRSLSRDADKPANPYVPYVPQETYIRPEPKIGRNDPCPCGSGNKYKKCCLANE